MWNNIKEEDKVKIQKLLQKLNETDLNSIEEGETEGSLDKARRELKTLLKEIGANDMYNFLFHHD